MDFDYPPSTIPIRQKIRAFLAEHLPPAWAGLGSLQGREYLEFVTEWRKALSEGGWLGLTWPEEFGGAGLSDAEAIVVAEELARAGVPAGGMNDSFSIGMLGNTILHLGTEEQKRYFLPRILDGTDVWCQGYSEPDSGSDLASLSTRAVADGDEWIINGQKIWTSGAQFANWMFVLCRTDPEAPAHRGISFILCPMDQPGVEVRPIEMISGSSEFNEVFFTDARAPRAHVIGDVNGGWRVAMSLLGYERGESAAVNPLRFRDEFDRLREVAASTGAVADARIRDRLASAFTQVEVMRFMGYAALTRFMNGVPPGPDAAITKIYWSEYHREVTELAVDILGMAALAPEGRPPQVAFATDDIGAPNSTASWAGVFLNARAGTIYAGTSEIQRNIVGEMMLGLPKEPRV